MYAPAPAIAQGKGECVHQISCGGPGLWPSIGRSIATCWTDHERTNAAAAYGRGGRARRRLSAVGSDRRHLHGKCISVGHTSREPLELGGRFRCPTFGQPIDIVSFSWSYALYQQGDQRGDNDALRSSIEVYRRALAEYPPTQAPLDCFRGNIQVSAADGETRSAVDWLGKGGRARKLHDAEITAARHKVGAVVCVKAAGMKEPWHLAASDGSLAAPEIIKLYAKRWTIEPSFRDSKDLRFGMGMSALRIDDPQRRDRLLLLNAFAILLLTILGGAGESLGMDRQLRTSTVKRRVHSLFRQGCLLYDLIPNMPEARLRPLIERYEELLRQNAAFSEAFGLA